MNKLYQITEAPDTERADRIARQIRADVKQMRYQLAIENLSPGDQDIFRRGYLMGQAHGASDE